MFGIQGVPHLVSCPESSIIQLSSVIEVRKSSKSTKAGVREVGAQALYQARAGEKRKRKREREKEKRWTKRYLFNPKSVGTKPKMEWVSSIKSGAVRIKAPSSNSNKTTALIVDELPTSMSPCGIGLVRVRQNDEEARRGSGGAHPLMVRRA